MRKILPARVKVTPMLGGGWNFSAQTDYSKVLLELGLDVVTRVLEGTATKRVSKRLSRVYNPFQ
jgi:hypothetical protein